MNPNERKQVLKLIGSMLNFQPHDYEQIEQTTVSTKWLSSLFSGSGAQTSGITSKNSSPSKTDALNKSFTDLLIQYVELESKPKPRVSLDIASNTTKSTVGGASGGLLFASTTNKKTDTPLFYSPSPNLANTSTTLFNPASTTLTQTTPTSSAFTPINRTSQQITAPGQTDYAILQSPIASNLNNRFASQQVSAPPVSYTPVTTTSLTPTTYTLSNNNNSFLEDALK